MILVIAYVAFIAYAAGIFVYSVAHERRWAAIGILLSVSGFQFTVMHTIAAPFALSTAFVGLGCVARDVSVALQPRLAVALARGRNDAVGEQA